MTRLFVPLAAILLLGSAVAFAVAQDRPAPDDAPLPLPTPEADADPAPEATAPGEVEEGFSLLEEGAKLVLRGLLDEVEPALRDMGEDLDGLMTEMQPALRELAELIGDIRNYHPPERLPNGDIILRRKVPLDPAAPGEGGPIDL